MTAKRTLLLAALVAALQIGFLGWMIAGRAAVLRDGREVLLKVEPVDPRDLLRGDYVRLGYGIGQIPLDQVTNLPPRARRDGRHSLYVRLAPGPDGVWTMTTASFDAPPAPPPGPGEVDIRGDVNSIGGTLRPAYGIERYYLPEGEGRAIETDMRERPFFIRLAVAADGTAVIKQFLDGDRLVYAEPLY